MSGDALGSGLSPATSTRSLDGWEGFLWAIWLLGSEPAIKHIYKNIYGYKPAVSLCKVADEKVTSMMVSAGESCGVQRS